MLSFWETNSLLQYDYAVIGAGIMGLSVASSILEKSPKSKIIILEKHLLPTGASTKNAGFACFGSLSELVADTQKMGENAMLTLVEKRWRGIQLLLKRLGKKNIDFQQNGGYELLLTNQSIDFLQKISHFNQLLFPIFKENVFHKKNEKINSFGFEKQKVNHLLFNKFEGQLDTGKLIKLLWEHTQKLGAKIITGAEVSAIENNQNGVLLSVKGVHNSDDISIKANQVIVCTNAFSNTLLPEIPIQPGRGQVLITKPLKKLKLKGTFHFDEGFYYFRNFYDRVIFGGGRNLAIEEETTTIIAPNNKIQEDLKEKLSTIILPNQAFEIEQAWAGIMAFSDDKQPVVGEIAPNIWASIRLNGMGIAISSALAEEITEQILSK